MEINDRKLPLRIDFISEFYYKNCQHIIDNILGELCPMTILRASTGQLKSKFYKKRGATFFYDITRKLGPLDFTQYRSKSSSF